MTLKLGNSEQNCEKKKCFKGFKTLGRRSRVLTNRGCKVLHTKLNFRSPYSHAENTAVPFCAGVENKQCFSPPSQARSGEPSRRGPAWGVQAAGRSRQEQAGVGPAAVAPDSASGYVPAPLRVAPVVLFESGEQLFSPRLLLSRNRQTHKYSDLYPPPHPSKFKALEMA